MIKNAILFVFLFILRNVQVSLTNDNITDKSVNATTNFFTAAVLEFNPSGNSFSNAKEKVNANLKEYIKWIYEAKEHNVDILVFPEATLNYAGLSRNDLIEFAIPLPEEVVDEYNCDYSSNTILTELSDAIGNASFYVLVNVVEIEKCNENTTNKNNLCLYNTNIVFNRYGCIISKYRKFNLFNESLMTAPKEADPVSFETDFGVTFGHFICFDILFKSPAYDLVLSNITHIIFPSMWYSQIPFLTSIQIQQSYAFTNNIVLLSSGANSPSNANTGSGIYIGKHGAAESIISYRNETKIIISKVPKDLNDDTFIPDNPTIEPYTATEIDKLETWSFNPRHIYPLTKNFHFNDVNIDCDFTINFTKVSVDADKNIGYTYKLAIFNGIRTLSNIVNAGEIYCAIVPCMTDDSSTCGQKFKNSEKLVSSVEFKSVKIVTKIRNSGDCLIMPTSLDFTLHPLSTDNFEFSKIVTDEYQVFSIETKSEQNELLTFGIYGRNFSSDNKNFERENDEISSTTEFEEVTNENSDDSIINDNFEENEEESNQLFGWILYGTLMLTLCIIAAFLVYRRLQHPYEHRLVVMRRQSEMHMA